MLLYTSYRKIYYWWSSWHVLREACLLLPSRRLSVFRCLKTCWIFTIWIKFLYSVCLKLNHICISRAWVFHTSQLGEWVGSYDGSRGLSLLIQTGQVNWEQACVFIIPFYICAVEKKKASVSSAKQIKWRSWVRQGLFLLVGRIMMADNWNYEWVGLGGE